MDLRISNGIIRGMREHGCISFKGIPYAKPPLAELRFQPPEPCEDWFGALDCTCYGPRPVQMPPPWCLDRHLAVYGEDCLNLNVWTPNIDDKKRPVLFNIYGGGHIEGSNSELGSEGYRLLPGRDMVVVAPNYRVGALGYLYLGHLLGGKYASSGNLGLMDLILALKWVQKNIAYFGGDPDRVTIVGQSAGAKSVINLLAAPEARNLFHGAVAMSGGLQSIKSIQTEIKLTKNFLHALELREEDAAKLLTLPAEDIVKAQERANQVYFKVESYGPTADGIVLPLDVEAAVRSGDIARVPVIMGHTKEELFFPPGSDGTDIGREEVMKKLRWKFGDNAERVMECYDRLRSEAEYPEAYGSAVTNYTYAQAYLRTASLLTQQKLPLWLYRWDYSGGDIAGHSSDNEALFGRTLPQKFKTNPEVTKLVDQLFRDAILNFVETGNPNGGIVPHWPSYDEEHRERLLIDAECHTGHLELDFDPSFPLQVFK